MGGVALEDGPEARKRDVEGVSRGACELLRRAARRMEAEKVDRKIQLLVRARDSQLQAMSHLQWRLGWWIAGYQSRKPVTEVQGRH